MKNLANCTPTEFLKQTYKIKRSAEKWLTDTDIINIRKRMPELTKITNVMTDEERESAIEANKKLVSKQVTKNLMDILDAILDKNAEGTLEILALCCFVEPEDVDNHPMAEYLDSITELISNKSVVGFFTSLARLGQTNI